MPLYAHNQFKQVVLSLHADKTQNYQCIECGEELRLRSSERIRAHFYHIKPRLSCFFANKSLEHIHAQWHLKDQIPSLKLEKRFPTINRIADCVYQEEKIIFEIQCSPIRPLEILQRNKDYASLGYQVIWVFHDKRYNKWRQSDAEEVLGNTPYYYTNINDEGKGFIYSQIGSRKEPLDFSLFKRDAKGILFFGEPIQSIPKEQKHLFQKILCNLRDGWEALFLFILENSCK